MAVSGIITKEYVHTLIGKRRADVHKGDCGKVLVIAGSEGMMGAAVLCGTGAYRAGCGLVRAALPRELYPILQIALPEATCVPRNTLSGTLARYDAIVIGPGLGDEKENEQILRSVLTEAEGTVVIDADGLNTAARCHLAAEIRSAQAQIVLTPHEGEAMRLLEMTKEEYRARTREEIVLRIADRFGATAVLKGAGTLVAEAGGKTYINSTGNAGMATGGSGDVLAGVIAGFSAQGMKAPDAAKAGVFVHGLAGDRGSALYSQHGLLAGDIAGQIGPAIKSIT